MLTNSKIIHKFSAIVTPHNRRTMDEQQEQQQQDEASVCLDYGEEDVISMEKEDSKFDLKSAGFQLAHLNPLSPPLLTRTNMNTICVCLVGLFQDANSQRRQV